MATFPTPIHLAGHEKVVEAFGYWPLFHDAEVRSVTLDRNRILFDTVSNPCIGLVIHAFEWTDAEVSLPPSSNHHLVHFEFEEVSEVRLTGFNHQNAVLSIRFGQADAGTSGTPRHQVHLDSAHGLSGSFSYARGRVASVIPCSEQGLPRG